MNRFGGVSVIPAAERGHVEYVRRVVTTGIDVDHVNRLGWTALLEAVVLGDGGERHQEVVRILLDAGADRAIADRDGVTALEHAERSGYSEIGADPAGARLRRMPVRSVHRLVVCGGGRPQGHWLAGRCRWTCVRFSHGGADSVGEAGRRPGWGCAAARFGFGRVRWGGCAGAGGGVPGVAGLGGCGGVERRRAGGPGRGAGAGQGGGVGGAGAGDGCAAGLAGGGGAARTWRGRWARRWRWRGGSRRRWGTGSCGLARALVSEMPATMRALTGRGDRGAARRGRGRRRPRALSSADRTEVDARVGPLLGRLGVRAAAAGGGAGRGGAGRRLGGGPDGGGGPVAAGDRAAGAGRDGLPDGARSAARERRRLRGAAGPGHRRWWPASAPTRHPTGAASGR